MLFTDVHAAWTESLFAGMNAATGTNPATGMKPTAAHAAKASSRVILTPRIPLQT